MKIKILSASLLLACTMSVAIAGKLDQPTRSTVQAVDLTAPVNTPDGTGAVSSVTLDFAELIGDSFDGQDDPDNVIASCVAGGSITGVEWTGVTVETVGASWLSEATFLFTDSAGGQGVGLNVGNGDGAPGVATYSSGGIVDFTDNGIPDIVALGDGQLPIQFFESFDDNPNALDANYTAGTLTIWGLDLTAVPCPYIAAPPPPPAIIPTLSQYGLMMLFVGLFFVARRKLS
ncbi:MAG: hypothetical protein JKY19_10070 [Alcanivoracaceae bacterium]|nr:hypothetical protein [Alcanivoracaceae bacterium]